MVTGIANILSTVALLSSLLTGDPSAGSVQANQIVAKVGVQQIKEGNTYEGLVGLKNLQNYAKKKSEQKVVWPHVLKEDPPPAPAPKLVVQANPAPQPAPTKTITVRSTAYTAHCAEGCTGRTATGINLNANPNIKLIAVDPNVIPLGKRVYVEGYGEAITGDTGGAIHGNKIDIYMASERDALNWGVRMIKVTILN